MTGEVVSRIIVHGFILLRLTDDDGGSSIQNYSTWFYFAAVD